MFIYVNLSCICYIHYILFYYMLFFLFIFFFFLFFFFFSSRRRHTRSYGHWSSDVCSSDLVPPALALEDQLAVEEDGTLVVVGDLLGQFHAARDRLGAHAEAIVGGQTHAAGGLDVLDQVLLEIGRASCRERV